MAKRLGSEEKPKETEKDRQAAIGGNLTQAVFTDTVHGMLQLIQKRKAVSEEIRKYRKTAQANGVELGQMDEVIRQADWERDEVRAHYETRRRYMEWLGLPIPQGDLFKDLPIDERRVADAHARGETDKRMGRSGQPPEDLADDLTDAYVRGFKGKPLKEEKTPKEKVKKDKDGNVLAPEMTPERKADAVDPAFN